MDVWAGANWRVQCSPWQAGRRSACFPTGKACTWTRSRTHLHPFVLHSAPVVHAAGHGAAAALPAAIPVASKVARGGEHVVGSGERETLSQRARSVTLPEVHTQCRCWEGSFCHGSSPLTNVNGSKVGALPLTQPAGKVCGMGAEARATVTRAGANPPGCAGSSLNRCNTADSCRLQVQGRTRDMHRQSPGLSPPLLLRRLWHLQ